MRSAEAVEVNRAYYERLTAGRDDYWKRMAAPRFRLATFLGVVAERAPGSLVDLGCGNGQLLLEIATRHPGTRLAGIDLSVAQIEANRRDRPGVTWAVQDLDTPAVPPADLAGRFDAVVASEIIEHVDHPGVFLRNALALAAPERGWLLLSTQSGPIRETERRVGHRRHYDAEAMRAALREAGWEPVRVWNAGFPFHDLSKWAANLDPDGSIERFGERPYGPAQKLACLALRAAFQLNSNARGAQLFAVARRPASAA